MKMSATTRRSAVDGTSFGDLLVRGRGSCGSITSPTAAIAEVRRCGASWFHRRRRTIGSDGYMQITDRSKDVIKSGVSGSVRSTRERRGIASAWHAPASRSRTEVDERRCCGREEAEPQLTREEMLAHYEGRRSGRFRRRGLRRCNSLGARQDAEGEAARAVRRAQAADS